MSNANECTKPMQVNYNECAAEDLDRLHESVRKAEQRQSEWRLRLEMRAAGAERARRARAHRQRHVLQHRARAARGTRRSPRSSHTKAAASAGSDGGGDGDGPSDPHKSKHEQTVILVKTRNKKLGKGVWASTLPVRQTCPRSCPFLDNGCYGQRGPGGHVARLERNAARQGLTALDIAREEARLIRRAARKAPATALLRLHVSGDSSTTESAEIVGEACEAWKARAWGYTHCWAWVPRAAWRAVSMLASIETPDQAKSALARGYAVSMTVSAFPNGKRPWVEGGVTWIPCPAQMRRTTCAECRLCLDDEGLIRRRQGIAFREHGSGKLRVRETLVQLRKKALGDGGAS